MVPLAGDRRRGALGTESSPSSLHESNVQVSVQAARKPRWTPLGGSGDGDGGEQGVVGLQEFGGIMVEREIDVSEPEAAHRGT